MILKEYRTNEIFNKWEQYVQNNKSSNVFNHPLWVKCLEEEYNRKATILICFDDKSHIRGVLPLIPTLGFPFKSDRLVTARRYSSLPRTPLGGILFDNIDVKQALINAAIDILSNSDKTSVQIKSYCPNIDEGVKGLKKFFWRDSFYIKLPNQPENIRFGNKEQNRKIKWAVNKARSYGISVREVKDEKDLINWYKLYLCLMRKHCVPPRRFAFFKSMQNYLQNTGMMKILLAELKVNGKKTPLAGSIFLFFNDTVFYSFNGRSKLGLTLHANDLIQWEAIHFACRNGFSFYDMGEVGDKNTGLKRFKAKWGCNNSYPIYHYYYSKNEHAGNQQLDITKEMKYPNIVWSKLPLCVVKFLGLHINRFL
ncbi:MAG: peptidoglycan bridge formation glycyltransferase FemA/FemB family protein [Candidatus Lokiarchaeia archaeon]|nr:peptidoglycan bridge formation glycyltransferase FemA/FemB family protein [Candidatus Lokiarchaeia archaeon]